MSCIPVRPNYFVMVLFSTNQASCQACDYERCVFVKLFSRWELRLHRLQIIVHLIYKLTKKEWLKRFNRFKDQIKIRAEIQSTRTYQSTCRMTVTRDLGILKQINVPTLKKRVLCVAQNAWFHCCVCSRSSRYCRSIGVSSVGTWNLNGRSFESSSGGPIQSYFVCDGGLDRVFTGSGSFFWKHNNNNMYNVIMMHFEKILQNYFEGVAYKNS